MHRITHVTLRYYRPVAMVTQLVVYISFHEKLDKVDLEVIRQGPSPLPRPVTRTAILKTNQLPLWVFSCHVTFPAVVKHGHLGVGVGTTIECSCRGGRM